MRGDGQQHHPHKNVHPTSRRLLRLACIPLCVLVLAMLACVGEVNMMENAQSAAIGCDPVPFTLLGETDHIWNLTLTPNARYRVTVVNHGDQHPTYWLHINVMVEWQNIADEVVWSTDEAEPATGGMASTTFVAPADGRVKIIVMSTVGEFQAAYGEHAIAVCEIDA